jgi:hypothetical protein
MIIAFSSSSQSAFASSATSRLNSAFSHPVIRCRFRRVSQSEDDRSATGRSPAKRAPASSARTRTLWLFNCC